MVAFQRICAWMTGLLYLMLTPLNSISFYSPSNFVVIIFGSPLPSDFPFFAHFPLRLLVTDLLLLLRVVMLLLLLVALLIGAPLFVFVVVVIFLEYTQSKYG